MGEAFMQSVASRLDDVGRCIEIGFPYLKMDDVAARCFQRPRLHQHFEGGLGAETRRALCEPEFAGLSHDGEISIIDALVQLVFLFRSLPVLHYSRLSARACRQNHSVIYDH